MMPIMQPNVPPKMAPPIAEPVLTPSFEKTVFVTSENSEEKIKLAPTNRITPAEK